MGRRSFTEQMFYTARMAQQLPARPPGDEPVPVYVELHVHSCWSLREGASTTDELIDRYYELTLRPGNRPAILKIFRAMIEGAKQDNPGVDRIRMPTLLLWGKEDPWVPLPVALRWLQVLPQAQYKFYDGVGHIPMEEIPMESALDVDRFIQTGSVDKRDEAH